jgi:hypothetical protein
MDRVHLPQKKSDKLNVLHAKLKLLLVNYYTRVSNSHVKVSGLGQHVL